MTLVKFNQHDVRNRHYRPFFAPLFDDIWGGSLQNAVSNVTVPAVNVQEKSDRFIVELAAPGRKKEDFKLELDKEMLSLSAELVEEAKEEKEGYSRREFNYSSFNRRFVLPDNVDHESITATYTDGILRVEIAKKADSNSLPKAIKIS